MSRRALFASAVLLGIVAVIGARVIGPGFLSLGLITGMLLLHVSVRMLTDDRAWPASQSLRLVLGASLFMIGSGWAFGGLVGLLALMGVEASETT